VGDELRTVARAPHRQANLEMRAGPVAVDQPHRSAVRLYAFGDNRKADAGSADRPALQPPPLIERFEDTVAVLGRDAGSRVRDLEHELRVANLCADVDRAAVRQELDRVRDQV